ncbi:MAG: Re/Si-specific NAD(P)(+) transhydrogenase subunit alpha [Desulfobulbaceae bacterium]|nr:Re/Si-specific NAD(P)(+) transhydrogenase subunit alpha [Desulfobulbaceae bacterium]
MKIAVLKETVEGEARVALVPDSVKRLVKKGFVVAVQSGAGDAAGFVDQEYEKAGAIMVSSASSLCGDADAVIKVQPPTAEEVECCRSGAVLISILQPYLRHDTVRQLAARRLSAFALDTIPRITLAQSMDVLSSMSTIAGYKSVLMAANSLNKFFPMLMTAAGTVRPAKVLVIGAGVAGLMACATAKRMGAVVEAFDVRPVVKEQVQSVGAKFVEVPVEESGEGQGGYAREMSDEYKRKQGELIAAHIAKADVVIPTALIPGRRAPILITEEMVRSMAPGSVVVDVAAELGGNCALTEPGQTVVRHGVVIVGPNNLPSTVPYHASQMFSKNIEKFLFHVADNNGFKMNMEDEITRGALITRDGEVVHEMTLKILNEAGGK